MRHFRVRNPFCKGFCWVWVHFGRNDGIPTDCAGRVHWRPRGRRHYLVRDSAASAVRDHCSPWGCHRFAHKGPKPNTTLYTTSKCPSNFTVSVRSWNVVLHFRVRKPLCRGFCWVWAPFGRTDGTVGMPPLRPKGPPTQQNPVHNCLRTLT